MGVCLGGGTCHTAAWPRFTGGRRHLCHSGTQEGTDARCWSADERLQPELFTARGKGIRWGWRLHACAVYLQSKQELHYMARRCMELHAGLGDNRRDGTRCGAKTQKRALAHSKQAQLAASSPSHNQCGGGIKCGVQVHQHARQRLPAACTERACMRKAAHGGRLS